MLLLGLIALMQLAVLVMILSVLAHEFGDRETERALAEQRIRSIHRQTVKTMQAAVEAEDTTRGRFWHR